MSGRTVEAAVTAGGEHIYHEGCGGDDGSLIAVEKFPNPPGLACRVGSQVFGDTTSAKRDVQETCSGPLAWRPPSPESGHGPLLPWSCARGEGSYAAHHEKCGVAHISHELPSDAQPRKTRRRQDADKTQTRRRPDVGAGIVLSRGSRGPAQRPTSKQMTILQPSRAGSWGCMVAGASGCGRLRGSIEAGQTARRRRCDLILYM